MINLIFGLAFGMLFPGYMLTMIFFSKEQRMEKILLTVMLGISFMVFLGLILGFNQFTYNATGGLSQRNVWLYAVLADAALLGYYLYKGSKTKK